ncbi:MAG: hypothetical protein MZV70_40440 [Desulfobacterales bacterium]|nr:hypothetical protein [Desulfobacterales bacterium]
MAGLKAGQIRRIQQLYRRKIPTDRVLTLELARHLCEISRETNRQIGVLDQPPGRDRTTSIVGIATTTS